MAHGEELGVIADLDELAALVERCGGTRDQGGGTRDQGGGTDELFVRWSGGPRADIPAGDPGEQSSRDALTGITLPGLSANSLRVEPWWGDRSVRLWVARRLYDYRHLRDLRGPGVRPWVLAGVECGRGPDNEPLVICHRPIAWVAEKALRECEEAVHNEDSAEWGPLNRADR